MKIEICEQLIASWLKHVKGCQVVQTNWRVSPTQLSILENDLSAEENAKINTFISEIKNLTQDENLDVFKNSKLHQFILQSEVDVIGIKVREGKIAELYLIDSAFHEDGLLYGDTKETTARVLKKIIRPLIVAGIVFKSVPAQIIFVSPKCGERIKNSIFNGLEKVRSALDKNYLDNKVQIIFNENFYSEILKPTIDAGKDSSDDNELFLRAVKLYSLYQGEQFLTRKPAVNLRVNTESAHIPDFCQNCDGKDMCYLISSNKERVFYILNRLKQEDVLTPEIVNKLCTTRYAKECFNLSSFPVLITMEDLKTSRYKESRFFKGKHFIYGGKVYLVCSQWIPERMRQLQSWCQCLLSQKNIK